MRAVVCNGFGPPEDLVVETVADPIVGSDQLLVEVAAAAVVYPDTLMIQDKYQYKAPPPYIPGGEVAGVVVAVGDRVADWSIGDRLLGALGATGGYAELCAVSASSARRLPESVDFAAAAGLNYAYGTTLYGLQHRANLLAGETLLVLGAGGSVGLSAVEIGKLMGARVIAAASTDEKLDVCRQRGADDTVNYSTENLKDRVKELTEGKGVDVVYDCVGGVIAEQALRAIAWEGRFLVVGFPGGIPSIPLNLVLLKSCQIVGVFYGAMAAREPARSAAISDQLIGWLASGELRPYVSARYPLERAGEALRAMMDRAVVGKVVIVP